MANENTGEVHGTLVQVRDVNRLNVFQWQWRPRRWHLITAALLAVVLVSGVVAYRALQADIGKTLRVDSVRTWGAMRGTIYAFMSPIGLSAADLKHVNEIREDGVAYQRWLSDRGGIVPNDIGIQIALRGQADTTSVITGMRVLKSCKAPATGALVYDPPAGDGERTVQIGFDLDQDQPVAEQYKRGDLLGDYFSEYTIPIKPDDVVTLVVHGLTKRQFCEFRLEITVNHGGVRHPVTQILDQDGQPFRVTSLQPFNQYREMYIGGVASPDARVVATDPATYSR